MFNAKKWAAVPKIVAFCLIFMTACTTPPTDEPATPAPEMTNEAGRLNAEIVVPAQVEVPAAAATTAPQAGTKDLIICMGQEPDTLYPYGSSMLASTAVQHAIFENNITTLSFAYQAQGLAKIPSLADGDARIISVEVNSGDIVVAADGNLVIVEPGIVLTNSEGNNVPFDGTPLIMEQMVVDFTLKARVWSDGVPVTAQDSVYSYNLVAEPATPQSKFVINRTASYQTTGNLTTRWIGIPGFYDATYFTNFWQPLPEHLWRSYTAAELLDAEASSRLPVGDGPFAIQEWVPGEQIRLVPNEFYYQEGLPYLDSITYKFIPDTNRLIAQLLNGECDIGTQDALGTDHSPFLLEAESNGLLIPYFQTGTVWEHIDFGINSEPGYAASRPDWYEDVRVRQAITLCTDRQGMVDEIMFGRSEVIHSYIPSNHPLYASGLTEWAYDVNAANRLLDEAGFVDSNGDGIREDPVTGRPFTPTLITTLENEMRKQLTQQFKENLLACGIDVQLDYLLSSELYAAGPEGPLFGRRFDMSEFAWGTGVQPPCEFYLSSEIPTAENDWAGQNNTGFVNSAFDAACLQARGNLPGTEAYLAGHAEAQRIFSEQLPVLPLFLRLKVAAARPDVLNFGVDPTQNSELYNLYELDLAQ
ncbi:MAG: peptide ABC transporter substrate-binding protein [Chloroflexota bacterium]